MIEVSVGITTFKRPDKLKRAIRSVTNQTFKNLEILVGNDDPEKKITKNKSNILDNEKIRLINNPSNLGERNNMNNLMNLAKGKYFIWLSDDDFLFPTFIERTINVIKDNDIVGVFSSYTSKMEQELNTSNFILYDQHEFLEHFLSKKIKLIGVYGLFKKETLLKIGGIQMGVSSLKNHSDKPTGIYPYSDVELPIRLSKHGKIAYTFDNLIYYETDNTSKGSSTKEFATHMHSEVILINTLNEIIKEDKNLQKKKNNFDYYLCRWFYINQISIIKRLDEKNILKKYFLIFKIILRYINRLNLKYKIKFLIKLI